jgi:hypothetical protein
MEKLNELLAKLEQAQKELSEALTVAIDGLMHEEVDEQECGILKSKVVTKENGIFFRAFIGDKILRVHVYPNGHYNVQTTPQIGSKKVTFKGEME